MCILIIGWPPGKKLEWVVAAGLSAILIVGCGGGQLRGTADASGATGSVASGGSGSGSGSGSGGGSAASPGIGASVSALLAYVQALLTTDQNSDAVDINSLTLAVDDTAEPSPISP